MEKINSLIQRLADKFKDNVRSPDGRKHGCLSHGIEDYLSHFSPIDGKALDEILHEDLLHWQSISSGVQMSQGAVQRSIDKFMKEQNEKLSELLNSLPPPSPLHLKKLPILSKPHKQGRIDFEWPTKEMLRDLQMPKLVKVEVWYF